MAASKITYPSKRDGDLFTDREANQIKSVVNEHADELDALQSQLNNTEQSFNNAITKSEQSLSDAEQQQVRDNIGAASSEDLENAEASISTHIEKTGIISFSGFVSNVELTPMSLSNLQTPPPVFFDRTRKIFVAAVNASSGAYRYYMNFSYANGGGIQDYADTNNSFKPWPSRVYKFQDKCYMWDGNDLVGITEDYVQYFSASLLSVTVQPGILNHWPSIESLSIQFAPNYRSSREYRLQFDVGSDDFELSLPEDVRWMNDEEPEWEQGWIYQVSIENGLAVAGGWPANE